MCGIAGIIERRESGLLGEQIRAMADALAHRGPDGVGYAALVDNRIQAFQTADRMPKSSRIVLAHRRLSIIDLSDAATQPMISEDGRRAMTYNGEIYNHAELRESSLGGRTWVSRGDTEVLFRLFGMGATDSLSDCVGMFAFGDLDLDRGTLTLVRDPFGIKPLYYLAESDRFAFASEIRPLLALLGRRPTANSAVVHRFLRYAVTDANEETFFNEIRQVPAGGGLEIKLAAPNEIRPFVWWKAEAKPPSARLSRASATDELRHLFMESVSQHMRADTPVATTLSGGIDSSAIVAAARRIAGPKATIHSFTYRADDARLDEGRFAKIAADASGVTTHEVYGTPSGLADDLDDLIASQEQPFTTTSMYAQALVFKAVAAAGFKVAIDGQGSDEIFAGYKAFGAARLAASLRRGEWSTAARVLSASGRIDTRMAAMAGERLLPDRLQTYVRRLARRQALPDWLSSGWFMSRHSALDQTHPGYGRTLKDELAAATWRASLPMLLRYADRNAMAVSVENRVPFLTPKLVRFAFSLPDEFLLDSKATTKSLLRDALRGLVPDVLLDRRDKIGFETPERAWFASSPALRSKVGGFLAGPLPPCFAPSFAGRARAMIEGGQPYDAIAWRAANLARWAELFNVDF